MKLMMHEINLFREILSPRNSGLDVVKLARKAELDPKTCFAGGDWRGVDFGRNDLSGFNFRGADLRGADLSRSIGMDEVYIDEFTKIDAKYKKTSTLIIVRTLNFFPFSTGT